MRSPKRQHPIRILSAFSRFLFLLLFPLPFIGTPLYSPFNFLFLSIFFTLGILWFWNFRFFRRSSSFYQEKGILFHSKLTLPLSSIHTIGIKTGPFQRLIGASTLFLDTPGGSQKKPNISLVVFRRRFIQWWNSLPLSGWVKAKNRYILWMSATWSNPASGLLLFAALINRTGKIFGQELADELYQTANRPAYLIALGIPPVAAGVGIFLLIGWLFAFFHLFLRYCNFSATQTGSTIAISRGILPRTRQLIFKKSICAVSIQQTLSLRLFHVSSVHLHLTATGKEKNDKKMVLASARPSELHAFLPFLNESPIVRIVPAPAARKSFLLFPLSCLLFILLLLVVLHRSSYISLFFFFLPVLLWLLAVRILASRETSLSILSDGCIAQGYHRFSLYTAFIPFQNLQYVSIRQNPFQKISGRCTLRLYIGAEKQKYFALRHLNFSQCHHCVSFLLSNGTSPSTL